MVKKILEENYLGCLLGGAIGDALGAPIEFESTATIKRMYGSKGVADYVEFGDETGEFTDDTQMTLFTVEGLLRSKQSEGLKGFKDSIGTKTYESYLRWLHTQTEDFNAEKTNNGISNVKTGWLIQQKELFRRRAPGNTCLNALRSGIEGTIVKPINNSKGCGGIMRMAPVGLIFPGQNEFSFKTGCELAAITHGPSDKIIFNKVNSSLVYIL